MIIIHEDKVNGTPRCEGEEGTQILNFSTQLFRKLSLTLYAAVENEDLNMDGWCRPNGTFLTYGIKVKRTLPDGTQYRTQILKMNYLNMEGWCRPSGTLRAYVVRRNALYRIALAIRSSRFLPCTYPRTFFGNACSPSVLERQRHQPTLLGSRVLYLCFPDFFDPVSSYS